MKNERYLLLAVLLGSALPFLLVELFPSWLYHVMDGESYLVFHNIAEFFSVMVSLSIFGVGWFSYKQSQNRHVLFLSAAFLAVGLLDSMHALGYSGMPAFITPNSVTKASQYWIAARFLDASAFLCSAFIYADRENRLVSKGVLLAAAFAIPAAVFTGVTFFPDQVPATFLPGIGLTPFKKISEYVIICLLLMATLAYWRRMARTGDRTLVYCVAAFIICIFSELVFTFYKNVFDSYNLLGHVYKIGAFSLVYAGIFASAVRKPWLRLTEEMEEHKRAKEEIRALNRELEQRVDERTEQLSRANLALVVEIAERKRAEEEQRHSKEQWERTFASVPDLIAILDNQHKVLRVNDAMAARLGGSPDDFIGLPCHQVVHGTSLPPEFCPHKKTVGDGCVHHEELHVQQFGGDFLVTTTPLLNEHGENVGSVHIAHDITVRKKAEAELQAGARRLAALLDAQHEIATTDLDYHSLLQLILEIMTRLTGAEGASLEVADGDEMVYEAATGLAAGFHGLRLKVAGSLSGLCLTDGELKRCDDSETDPRVDREASRLVGLRSMLLIPLRYDEHSFGVLKLMSSRVAGFEATAERTLLLMAEFLGVTVARKQAQAALRESEERFRVAQELSPDCFTILRPVRDGHGCVQDFIWIYENTALARLNGTDPQDVVGRRVLDVVPGHANTPFHRMYARVAQTGQPGVLEGPFKGDTMPEQKWFRVTAVPIGQDLAIHAHDITERKLGEDSLKQMNEELERRVAERTAQLRERDQMLLVQSRQAAMGEMIGNIAHQWRQPLNSLALLVQEIAMVHEVGELDRRYVEEVEARSMAIIMHMSRTIDDFRNFFRPDKEKVTFSVSGEVKKTLSLVEAGFHANDIQVEVAGEADPVVHGYPNEYSQVLLNILLNARDALVARRVPERRVRIVIGDDEVKISDNAGGIPDEIIAKIFDPYFTTKGPQEGTGVGLFMSKNIIEKNMGGELSVCNTREGAEFRIRL